MKYSKIFTLGLLLCCSIINSVSIKIQLDPSLQLSPTDFTFKIWWYYFDGKDTYVTDPFPKLPVSIAKPIVVPQSLNYEKIGNKTPNQFRLFIYKNATLVGVLNEKINKTNSVYSIQKYDFFVLNELPDVSYYQNIVNLLKDFQLKDHITNLDIISKKIENITVEMNKLNQIIK